jgi:N,N'-diacetyllegionaminate synthase
MARELVDVAVKARADAVKFQTFKPEKVCSPSAPKAEYQLQTTSGDESQLEMGKKLELPFEAFRELQAYCKSKDLLFLSTPFDYESAEFLAELSMPALKIRSGEIANVRHEIETGTLLSLDMVA